MNSKYQIGQKINVHVFGKGQLGTLLAAVIEDVELDDDSEMYFVRYESGRGGWVSVLDVREVE